MMEAGIAGSQEFGGRAAIVFVSASAEDARANRQWQPLAGGECSRHASALRQ